MANSLRAKIRKLKHDGYITDAECKELLNKLDGHDKEIINATIDEFTERIIELVDEFPTVEDEFGEYRPMTIKEMCNVIAEQMKGE